MESDCDTPSAMRPKMLIERAKQRNGNNLHFCSGYRDGHYNFTPEILENSWCERV